MNNTQKFNQKNIHDLLVYGFTEGELRNDLCFLEPNFRLLFPRLAQYSSKADVVYQILQFAEQRMQFESLLAWAKAHNSTMYEHYQPYLVGDPPLTGMVKVLFLAADPTNATRLRLDEEFREIQEKLQLAKLREHFELHVRMAVRPQDITQALLDVQPQILHFAGHGIATTKTDLTTRHIHPPIRKSAADATLASENANEVERDLTWEAAGMTTGALCFVNQMGEIHPIKSEALADMFKQFTKNVNCVVLNSCYSELQAKVIAQYINYVVGTQHVISDQAAIAFSIGFYQALGAGLSLEDAFELGRVQIRLQDIPEHLTPVLTKKSSTAIGTTFKDH